MKYLKTYRELNESLRDKMEPISDDVIQKHLDGLDFFDKINFIKTYNLGNKFRPTIEEIRTFFKEILSSILKYHEKDTELYYKVKNILNNIDDIDDYGYFVDFDFSELFEKNTKYLKTYRELNEGLRDKMTPIDPQVFDDLFMSKDTYQKALLAFGKDVDKEFMPTEEEIVRDTNPLQRYKLVSLNILDKKYDPTKDEMLDYINKNIDTIDKNLLIQFIFELNLDFDLLPRNKDGWCVYDGEEGVVTCSNHGLTELPDKLEINGEFYCEENKLTKLPPNLIINGHLYCSYNELTELPETLVVTESILCQNNKLTHLPKNLKLSSGLYCDNNNITEIPGNYNNLDYINCDYNYIFNIADGLTVNYDFHCSNNDLKILPKGLKVGGELDITGNDITELPDDLIVDGILYIDSNEDTKKMEIPKGVKEINYS